MLTKNVTKKFPSLVVRQSLSQAPIPITELEKELDLSREDIEIALANAQEATETKDGWITSALTIKEQFRNIYYFTPTNNQIDTLRIASNAIVFWHLSYRWQGVPAIAQATGLSQKAVRESLKELKKQDLAHGLDDVWIRNFEVDDIELARTKILELLDQPQSYQDICNALSNHFTADVNSAIALLEKEALIVFDKSTNQYRLT